MRAAWTTRFAPATPSSTARARSRWGRPSTSSTAARSPSLTSHDRRSRRRRSGSPTHRRHAGACGPRGSPGPRTAARSRSTTASVFCPAWRSAAPRWSNGETRRSSCPQATRRRWMPGAASSSRWAVAEGLDPITLEVVRNRLQHLTREMAAAIVKTAVSPLISEARDFSCILYDAAGRIVATASTVPFHFGVCAGAVAAVLARFGGRIAPGDVFLANDPHDGGGLHLQDVVVMRPVFRGRTRIGWASASGHMVDMGGMVPGSFAPAARDCFQEGVRVPPVRLLARGQPVDDIWRLLLNNVRQRDMVEMDLKSLVAGTYVGAEKVCELEHEVGATVFRASLATIRRRSARVLQARIGELPRGEYSAQGWVEFDEEAFLVRCTLRVG